MPGYQNIELFLYEFPLWGFFIITLVVIFAGFELGFYLGKYKKKHSNEDMKLPVGPMVAATLGLLAFMLTFTFGVAASHFTTRRSLVLDESNAIRSAYVMSDMLNESSGIKTKALLRDYVDIRLEKFKTFDELSEVINKSNIIQNKLWTIAMSGEDKKLGTSSSWLYIQYLNDMFDMQAKRLSYGTHGRVPFAIWLGLYWLVVLGMAAMGFHCGLIGHRGFFAYFVLIFTFSMVIVLIYDLDRPQQELFKVNKQAMINLQDRMNTHDGVKE